MAGSCIGSAKFTAFDTLGPTPAKLFFWATALEGSEAPVGGTPLFAVATPSQRCRPRPD